MRTLDYNDVLDAVGDEDSIHTNYSGRGMYGKECFGIVGNIRDFGSFVAMLICYSGLEEDDVLDLVDSVATDNMGLDNIYYFPGWTLENVPEEDA